MPTALPRLPVTLNAEQRDLLARMAKASRTSQSKVLTDLLDAAAPVLLRVIAALENVQKLDAEKRSAIREAVEQAQADAEHTAATALALLERIAAPPVGAARMGAQPAPRGPAAARPATRKPPARRRAPPPFR